ncbi:MAG: hypothetical protein HYX29_01950 [Solirubrobacterales bacterium]|nr:hypothetical protein [Solirubrobacterales bacterium]
MYRLSDHPPDQPDSARPGARPTGRRFAPVPLGIFSGFLGLSAQFFGMFLMAWGMAPTSIGCGPERAVSMTGIQLAIAAVIFGAISFVGLGIMRDAQESSLRRRSYLLTFGAIYVLGSIPLFVAAALLGSCFDF